jgi:hypothetical protein
VASPAEFFDRVARCSDCGTRLVGSEDDAIAGRQMATRDPYRMLAAVPRELDPKPVERWVNGDAELSMALILLGLLVSVAMFTSGTGGVHVVAVGPMLYGLFRLLRSGPAAQPRR